MKKAKILALAAVIACATMIASCSEAAASSSGDSSVASSESESTSSDDSSDYTSSEDSGAEEGSGSEDSSSEDSSSDDSSSDSSSSDDGSSSSEDANTATVTLTLADNLYAYVYVADTSANEHPAETDERILGSNGYSYENYSASVTIGDSIFIESLNNYSVDYTLSTEETGTIAEYDVSALIQVTGDLTISLSATPTYELAEVNNYYSEYISDISISAGEEYAAGATVEYSFSSSMYTGSQEYAEQYLYGYYITVNGETSNPSSVVWESAYVMTYYGSFTMPEEDVVVDFVYASTTQSDSGYTVSVEANDNVQALSVVAGVGHNANSTFYLVLKKNAGVTINDIQYSIDGADYVTGNSISGVYTTGGNTNSDVVYRAFYSSSFSGVTSNITFKIDATAGQYYNLTLVNAGNITISRGSTYSLTPAAGDVIYFSYSGADGYYVSAAATIEAETEGTEITISSNTTSTLRFTMPADNVTVTFNLAEQVAFSYSTDYASLSTQICIKTNMYSTDTYTHGTPGSTVYVCAYPAAGYVLSGYKIGGTEYTSTSTNTSTYYGGPYIYVSYSIPSTQTEAITIEPIVKEAYTVTNNIESKYATVRIGSSSDTTVTYEADTSVTVQVSPTAYYTISSITFTCADGTTITPTENTYSSYNSYTFTMPSQNVTITGSFTENKTVTLTMDTSSVTSGLISSAYIRGNSTGTETYSTSTTGGSYVVGESVSVYVYFSDASYTYTINAVTTSGTTALTSTYTSSTYTYYSGYTVTEDLKGFSVTAEAKVYLTATVNDTTGLTVTYAYSTSTTSYTSSLTTVTSLNNCIYSGYYVYFKVSGDIPTGSGLVSSVTLEDGTSLSVTTSYLYDASYNSETWYRFQPTGNFTLSLSLETLPTVTIYNESNYDVDVMDSNWNTISSGSTFSSGSTLRLYSSESGTVYYYIDYSDSTTDESGTLVGSYSSYAFSASCDITVYFTESEYTPSNA